MDAMKGKSAMLMTKGIMEVRTNPPSLVCRILSFEHPQTKKAVTLIPIPNIAGTAYFRRVLDADNLMNHYDKILCEDGRLPFQAGSAEANKQQFMRRLFPFFSLRPVVSDGEKFDGITQRDAIESRMAYQMVLDGWNPPVDPRARRGIERILDNYEANTKVAVPWGVYHLPYFRYRLLKEGFVESGVEEVTVFGVQEIAYIVMLMTALSLVSVFIFFRMLFG